MSIWIARHVCAAPLLCAGAERAARAAAYEEPDWVKASEDAMAQEVRRESEGGRA